MTLSSAHQHSPSSNNKSKPNNAVSRKIKSEDKMYCPFTSPNFAVHVQGLFILFLNNYSLQSCPSKREVRRRIRAIYQNLNTRPVLINVNTISIQYLKMYVNSFFLAFTSVKLYSASVFISEIFKNSNENVGKP
jgi:hypothetical protein